MHVRVMLKHQLKDATHYERDVVDAESLDGAVSLVQALCREKYPEERYVFYSVTIVPKPLLHIVTAEEIVGVPA